MSDKPIAVQLYTVRDAMEADAEAEAALRQVRESGYRYVELAGLAGRSPEAFRDLLMAADLTAVSAHVGLEELADLESVVYMAKCLGLDYVVCPWAMEQRREGWAALGTRLGKMASTLAGRGIHFGYHNHAHEFMPVYDGARPIDIILEAAGDAPLMVELDTYWVDDAGGEPVTEIERFADRCPILHIKDRAVEQEAACPFVPAGKGRIEWEPIFAAGHAAGVKWFVAELDECPYDPMQCIAECAAYMHEKI